MSERRTLGRTIQQVYEGEVSELVCTDLGGFLSECPICVFYVLSSISLCWRRVREHFESILDSGIIILSWVVWGLVRWCTMESKVFELAVEGSSASLRIREKCRGFTRSIYLRRNDSCWLIDIIEELLSVKGSSVF